ncbi:MAG TPA: tripartite tricarboxylate transporter substrate binding protein [Xanthobacteraceae bacterium]|jgi:tripartite-type tricarboxylate transporter receptor subunit TctC|nr:tripartite tricarboxylate transporter substrate binding protein [Xanthobacteraceae bacterium]
MCAPAGAGDFPDRPVKILVGITAGSAPDIEARTVAAQLGKTLKQSFYVENRPGANQTIAAHLVAQSEPNGYTLLFASSGIAPAPYVYKNPGFDLLKDLRAVSTAGIVDGLFMVVRADSDIKSVAEFIDHAKNGRLLYGTPGVGNILHLATELFSKTAGITLTHVPYNGSSQAVTALLAGDIQVMFVTPTTVGALIKGGQLRALAFTGTKPFPGFTDVPLLKDLVPGYEPIGSWGMFFAPANTPDDAISYLNKAIHAALKEPEVEQVFSRNGDFPDARDADATEAFFKSEVSRMIEAAKIAGIKPE